MSANHSHTLGGNRKRSEMLPTSHFEITAAAALEAGTTVPGSGPHSSRLWLLGMRARSLAPPARQLWLVAAVAAMLCGPLRAGTGGWTVHGPDIVGVNLYGVTYTPRGFLAVGPAGTVAESAAGQAWVIKHLYPADLLLGIGHGAGRFVCVGWNYTAPHYGRGVIWSSPDGANWEQRVNNAYGAFTRVVYGQDRFVAVGGSGWLTTAGVIATSTNGTSWDHCGIPYSASYLKDVVFAEDRFLHAAYSGVFVSLDGVNWTNSGASLANPIGLAARDATVVCVGRWGAIQRSTDLGQTWENAIHPDSGYFTDVGAGPGLFVAVGDQGHIATSADGLSWADQDSGTTALLEDVAYGAGTWVVVGRGGSILTSTNGTQWDHVSSPTPGFSDVAFGGGRFVAVSPQALVISDDGVAWVSVPGQTANSVAYGNGEFVAVGKDIKVSKDGSHWNVCAPSPKWELAKVVYGGGQFTAVGGVDALEWAESIAYQSADGTNWLPATVSSVGKLDSLAFVNGEFVTYSSRYPRAVVVGGGTPPSFAGFIPAGGLAGGHAGLLAVETSGYVSVGGQRSPRPLASSLNGAGYADGHYFAFGGGWDGTTLGLAALWVSENGTAWRDVSPPTDRQFRAAAIGHGRVVVVGDGTIVERNLDDGLVDTTSLAVASSGSRVELGWLSKQGHYYRLEASTNLMAWESVLDANSGQPLVWSGTGQRLTWGANAPAARTFYRLFIAAQ